MTTAMTQHESSELTGPRDLMPAMSVEQMIQRYNIVIDVTKRVMKKGRHYGTIPGTERRGEEDTPSNRTDTLLKPGAELLNVLFGLVPDFDDYRVTEDWDKGFFYYAYKCNLTRGGRLVASAIGSCNSREKKYRRVARKCPECGTSNIKRSKFPPRNQPTAAPGWYCHEKPGGCGAQFNADDKRIIDQAVVTDPSDSADLVNTLQKMAQKRALVGATLIATNASEFFTQDLDDLEPIDGELADPVGETGYSDEAMARWTAATSERLGLDIKATANLLFTAEGKQRKADGKCDDAWLESMISRVRDGQFDRLKVNGEGNKPGKPEAAPAPTATTSVPAAAVQNAANPSAKIRVTDLSNDNTFWTAARKTCQDRGIVWDMGRLVIGAILRRDGLDLKGCDNAKRNAIVGELATGEPAVLKKLADDYAATQTKAA